MDDALALCAVDLCGRPYLQFDCTFPNDMTGGFDTSLVKEFFYAVSYSAAMNIHVKMLNGENSHHMIEAVFKAFAKALDDAVAMDARIKRCTFDEREFINEKVTRFLCTLLAVCMLCSVPTMTSEAAVVERGLMSQNGRDRLTGRQWRRAV